MTCSALQLASLYSDTFSFFTKKVVLFLATFIALYEVRSAEELLPHFKVPHFLFIQKVGWRIFCHEETPFEIFRENS